MIKHVNIDNMNTENITLIINNTAVNDAINASMSYINEYEWVRNMCKSLHISAIGIPVKCGLISDLTFKQYSNYLNNSTNKTLIESCHEYDENNEDDNNVYVLSDMNSHYYAFNYDANSKVPLVIQAALNIMTNVAKNPMSSVLFNEVNMNSINAYIMRSKMNSFTNLVKSMNVFNQYGLDNLLDSWANDMNDGYLINPKIYVSAYPIMSKVFGNDWNRMITDDDMRGKLIGNDNVQVRQISRDSERMITNMIQNVDDDSKMRIAVDYIIDMDKEYSINASAIMSGYMGNELKEKFLANPYASIEFAKNVLESSVPLDNSEPERAIINEQFDLFIKSNYDVGTFKILNELNNRKHSYDITEALALYYVKYNMNDGNVYSKSIIDLLHASIITNSNAVEAFMALIENNNLNEGDKRAFYAVVMRMVSNNYSYSYYTNYNQVRSRTFNSIFTLVYYFTRNNSHKISNDDIIIRIIECYSYADDNNYKPDVVFSYSIEDANIEYPLEYIIENLKLKYADNDDKIRLHSDD